ncbi:hypothetical protein MMC07_008990 [Pseudocyphellaria aurata]|nr:hypothetical protein [Pseudocyphellaria aurata]
MAETSAVGFPFLKLPPEVRDMVLKELLVMPGPIDTGRKSIMPPRVLIRNQEKNVYSKHPPIFGAFLLSKQTRQAALSIYFGCNGFIARHLTALAHFLYNIGADACNAIRKISIEIKRLRNARKAFKLLAQCGSLRSLQFAITPKLFWTDYDVTAFVDLPGVQDLLKIRGVQELEVVEGDPRFIDERLPWSKESILQALQILKEPRDSQKQRRLPPKELWSKVPMTTRAMASKREQSRCSKTPV